MSYDFYEITALEVQLLTNEYKYVTYHKQGQYVYSDDSGNETNEYTRSKKIEGVRRKVEMNYNSKKIYENNVWLVDNHEKYLIYKAILDKHHIKLQDVMRIIKVKYTSLPLVNKINYDKHIESLSIIDSSSIIDSCNSCNLCNSRNSLDTSL